MITKKDARKFCSAYNAAPVGAQIEMRIGNCEPFATVERGQPLDSTEAAYQFMYETFTESIRRLNNLTKTD